MRRSSIVATRRAEGLPNPKIDMRGYMIAAVSTQVKLPARFVSSRECARRLQQRNYEVSLREWLCRWPARRFIQSHGLECFRLFSNLSM